MWIINLNKRKDQFEKSCSNCGNHTEDYVLVHSEDNDDSWDEFKVWCQLTSNEMDNWWEYSCEKWKPCTYDGTKEEYDNFYRLTEYTKYPQDSQIKSYMKYTDEQIISVFEERRKMYENELNK